MLSSPPLLIVCLYQSQEDVLISNDFHYGPAAGRMEVRTGVSKNVWRSIFSICFCAVFCPEIQGEAQAMQIHVGRKKGCSDPSQLKPLNYQQDHVKERDPLLKLVK